MNLIKKVFSKGLAKSLNTITTKLLMLFLFMTIIPLMLLAQYSTDLISTNMADSATNLLDLNVKLTNEQLNESLNSLKVLMVQGISSSIEDAYFKNAKIKKGNNLSKSLKEIIRKSDINYLIIFNKKKEVIASSTPSMVGKPIKSFDALIDTVFKTSNPETSIEVFNASELEATADKLIYQSQIRDLDNKNTYLIGLSQMVALPIINKDNDIEAVAVAGKFLVKDNKFADDVGRLTGSTIMIAQILHNGDAIVISTNLTTKKGSKAIGKMIPFSIVKALFGSYIPEFREYQIREYELAKYSSLKNISDSIVGVIYTGLPEQQFTRLVKQNVWLVSVISITGLFAAIILAAFFSRSISTPILKLAEAAKKISLGDLGIRVNVKGSQEIAQMGEAFNIMAENLQKEESLRDDFVATLTHDLKVPLLAENQTIKYMLNASYGEINEEQKEVLEIIKTTNESSLDMVNTLLEVYRYDAGKNILLKSETDLKDLINVSVQSLSSLAESKKLQMIVEIPDEAVMVSIDEREIKRVMSNLISNAISSTLQRGIIKIAVTPYKHPKLYTPSSREFGSTTLKQNVELTGNVIVCVYDTGIGIEKEDIDNLFKRFSGNKGRKPSSTGLGLYYSHQVITAHGGKIWAESKEGEGSVFKFTLPLLNK